MIYLDNAATTPPLESAFERAAREYRELYYNPSARYGGGFAVRKKIEEARKEILSVVADPALFELIFTSCGTEADNHAVFSCARRGNAVTSAGEHSAIERSFTELKNRGVEPRFAPLNLDGSVKIPELLSLVDDRTTLVSVVHVNNETGAINDIAEIARSVKRKNPRVIVHSDGVQAFGKLPFRLPKEVDLYSISAHKIGALKGTGALIKRKDLTLAPFIHGGGQEGGLRSGTENVLGILDFAYAAAERAACIADSYSRVAALRADMWDRLQKSEYHFFCASPEAGSPYILTLLAIDSRGEVLQRMLFDRGVCVGTGSACSSKERFSRVMRACGYAEEVLDGVLRVSFSPETTQEEVELAAREMISAAMEFKGKL